MRTNKYNGEKNKKSFNFETAEKKLLIILCYYILFPVTSLTHFTFTIKEHSRQIQAIQELFVCEQEGISSCDRTNVEYFNRLEASILSVLLICLYPVVYFFMFVLTKRNMKAVKHNYSSKTQDIELKELH